MAKQHKVSGGDPEHRLDLPSTGFIWTQPRSCGQLSSKNCDRLFWRKDPRAYSGEDHEEIKMKDLKYIIIIAILVSFITIVFVRSCNDVSDRDLSELKGRYEAYKEETEKEKKETEKIVAAREEKIVELKNEIISNFEAIDRSQKEAKVKDKEISELVRIRETLTDKDLIIANQDKQIKAWIEKFTLEREEKVAIREQRDDWKAAYYLQVDITEQLKKQLSNELSLRKIGEESLAAANKTIRKLKLGSSVKTVLIGALAGYVAYKVFK